MSYNPDPIFRDGLNGYRKPAPPSAWERIESGLERKRQKSMWIKIAAGLLIVLTTSIFLLQRDQTDPVVATNLEGMSVTTMKTDTIGSALQIEISPRETAGESRELQVNHQKPAVGHKSSVVSRQSSINRNDLANTQVESVPINEPEENLTDSIVVAEVEKTNELSGKIEVSETNRTNLTYTADQVNAKFIKQNVAPEATPEKKSASGLKTVIDKALEITNDGTVFGEIREKKNEWLSFNNLSNKTEPNK